MSQLFIMEQADYDSMVERMTQARSTPLIMLQCGMPPSVQEVANNEWKKLGDKLGFDYMSVKPGPSKLQFYADAKETSL